MGEPARADRSSQRVRTGQFEIDLNCCELYKSGRRVALQEQPFRVLGMLVERPGELVTRQELQTELWPSDTYVGFDEGLNTAIRKLRLALGDSADNPRFIETVPRRGYRFIAPVTRETDGQNGALGNDTGYEPVVSAAMNTDLEFLSAEPARGLGGKSWLGLHWKWLAVAAAVCTAIVAGSAYRSLRTPAKLSEGDTMVLADFVNATGDPVFDESLKEALAVQLEQSPFMAIVPDSKVLETLRMMGRPSGQQVSGEVGLELCQRIGSKALLQGTISTLGDHYLIGLNAVACGRGNSLAREQVDVARKEDVLKALRQATKNLRTKLGESMPLVQKYDVPIEATTTSLEALKAYSLAIKAIEEKGDAASIPFLKRAIELDPVFPMAYANLAARYSNLMQPSRAMEAATKAYQLRDKVTEREKLRISSLYFRLTGELEKQTQILELWMAEYPQDFIPHGSLGVNYFYMGEYERALSEWQTALRLEPDNVITVYENLASVYIALNRLDEAEAVCNQALVRKLDSGGLRWMMYYIAFLRNDPDKMGQQAAWAASKLRDEGQLLFAQSNTEAYYGRLNKARDFSRQAVDSAIRADSIETAALWQVTAGLREAEFGNKAEAKRNVAKALALSSGRNVQVFSALALARLGETAQAKRIAEQLRDSYPSNTVLTLGRLPAIDAAIELNRGDPAQALRLLETAMPYELGQPSPTLIGTLYIPYLRGQACLLSHDTSGSVREYQKIIDHPGITRNEPTGPLAHLGLARAYAMQGDIPKAKSAYQDFLILWKDADPDIPVLKEAKAEYAKLQ